MFSYLNLHYDVYNTFQSLNVVYYFHIGYILGIVATSFIDYFLEIYFRWEYEYKEMLKG